MQEELEPFLPWQFRTTAAGRSPSDFFDEICRAGTLSEGNVRSYRKEREKRVLKGRWERREKIDRTDGEAADDDRLRLL